MHGATTWVEEARFLKSNRAAAHANVNLQGVASSFAESSLLQWGTEAAIEWPVKRLTLFLGLILWPVPDVAASPSPLHQELDKALLRATEASQAWSLIDAAFPGLDPLEVADPKFFDAHESVWKWVTQRDTQYLLDLKEGPRRVVLSVASLSTLAKFRDALENDLEFMSHPQASEVLRMITVCETSLQLVIGRHAPLKIKDVFPFLSPFISGVAGALLLALDHWAGNGETHIVWTDIAVLFTVTMTVESMFKLARWKFSGFFRNRFSVVPALQELRARLTSLDGLPVTVDPLTRDTLYTTCQDLLWLRR